MLTPGVPEGVASYATMATLPGKKPLIELSDRPPNYEAPLEYLRTPITPNSEKQSGLTRASRQRNDVSE
jgi:hypothetical protein